MRPIVRKTNVQQLIIQQENGDGDGVHVVKWSVETTVRILAKGNPLVCIQRYYWEGTYNSGDSLPMSEASQNKKEKTRLT